VTGTGIGVSFVVPVYNGRRWLASAIDGIEGQRDGRSRSSRWTMAAVTDRSAC
jgi:hypothetical protein